MQQLSSVYSSSSADVIPIIGFVVPAGDVMNLSADCLSKKEQSAPVSSKNVIT